MKKSGQAAAAAFVLLLSAHEAQAAGEYKGKRDAKTTIEQEFRDATWVVKAKVVGGRGSCRRGSGVLDDL